MIGRSTELTDVLAYVELGVDVTISGAPGSGRSLFLRVLHDELIDAEYTVRRVSGVRYLHTVPLAALHETSGTSAVNTRMSPIAEAIHTLIADVGRGRLVILIDDADLLDDASWGAILAAQTSTEFRIVSAQLPVRVEARDDLHLARRRAYTVHLLPLRLDEMETLLEDHLSAPVDPSSISRIFAKSAGLPGLAIGMVDVGRQEKRITQRNGVWAASGDLWSPALDRLIERQIRVSGRQEREALEVLSAAGPLEMADAIELVGEETLEKLESRGLLHFSIVSGALTMTITPPLIAEYFRHSPLRARVSRIAKQSHREDLLQDSADAASAFPAPDAIFVRVVQEQARRHLAESERQWAQSPSPATLVRYATDLSHDATPAPQLARLFKAVPTGDASADAQLLSLQGRWIARQHGHEAAQQFLTQHADDAGNHAGLLAATAVRLRLDGPGYTGDPASDLPLSDAIPQDVRRELHTVRALAFLTAGRLDDAGRELAELPSDGATQNPVEIEALRALYLLGIGDYPAALRTAHTAFETARESMDKAAIRIASYTLAYCRLLSGNNTEVIRLADTALALGFPHISSRSSLLGLLCMASICAGRIGRTDLARNRLAQAERLTDTDGPLPTMAPSWPRSQVLFSEAHPAEAIQALRHGAERLWEHGARWSAVQAWLIELELEPDLDRYHQLTPRFDLVDGEFVAALRDYVEGLAHQDPIAIAAIVPRLTATGRPGFAISALHSAARLHLAADRPAEADRLAAAAADLAATLPPDTDRSRFRSADILLTHRERQLAQLAAQGLTNAEIAAQLVLSVRTVESHLHRVMRKAHVSSRTELGDFLGDHAPTGR